MAKLLTLLTERRADHRAVFNAFAAGLERVLRRQAATGGAPRAASGARIRAIQP
jgi:hypothetical protein